MQRSWTAASYFAICIIITSATFRGIPGDYCKIKRGRSCCPNRDDDCVVPIVNSLCYCDTFCERSDSEDCCPDFRRVCRGESETSPAPLKLPCFHDGTYYSPEETVQINCNKCVCTQISFYPERYEFQCQKSTCLIRQEVIDFVNKANLGWTASNYSFLWGQTLQAGITYHLGTLPPQKNIIAQTEINSEDNHILPPSFDARAKWPNLIQPVQDQGSCGSSWALSTAAVASDRISIISNGTDKVILSPQQLLSCSNRRQQGCNGGHLDRAWRFVWKKGIVTEDCYPYHSGIDGTIGRCEVNFYATSDKQIRCANGNRLGKIYIVTPPYRVANSERNIMKDIMQNGPVQATFLVHEDFYMYSRGVYQYSRAAQNYPPEFRKTGYHSVRILGWGVDYSSGSPIPYWLCVNSWGSRWGEGGYFRIRRGNNESQIESLIIGVWGKPSTQNYRSQRRRYSFRKSQLNKLKH